MHGFERRTSQLRIFYETRSRFLFIAQQSMTQMLDLVTAWRFNRIGYFALGYALDDLFCKTFKAFSR